MTDLSILLKGVTSLPVYANTESATRDSAGTQMSAATLLCLSAPSGPVGLTHKCQVDRLQLRRRRANQHDRYQVGAVCQPKVMCATHVGQAPAPKSFLQDPKILNALQAISLLCGSIDLTAMAGAFRRAKHAELIEWGLHEGLFKTLTHQEQAELLSLAFVDWVVGDVTQRSSALAANTTEDAKQQSLTDMLSLTEVAAAVQQVPLEWSPLGLRTLPFHIVATVTMPCLQVSSNKLVDICYMAQTNWCMAIAIVLSKQLVCYCCARNDLTRVLKTITTCLSTHVMLVLCVL